MHIKLPQPVISGGEPATLRDSFQKHFASLSARSCHWISGRDYFETHITLVVPTVNHC